MNALDFCIGFMKHKCSPFQITFNGMNSLHIAAKKGSSEVLELFCFSIYNYDHFGHAAPAKAGGEFNKVHALNTLSIVQPSSPLHLAIEAENY
jgi:hypothetical protein